MRGCPIVSSCLLPHACQCVLSQDTKCLIGWNDDTMVISFRGTASMANVASDLKVGGAGPLWECAWLQPHAPAVLCPSPMASLRVFGSPLNQSPPSASPHHPSPQVWRKIWPKNISTKRCWKLGGVPRVHSGFYHAYTANGFNFQLMKRLKSLLLRLSKDNPGKRVRVYVTGHSLGGALATLCAYDVMTHCQMNHAEHYEVSCYTFGAPRTGNHAFAKLFASVVPDTWHIINSDVRPLLLCGGRGPWGVGAWKGSTPSPALPKTARRGGAGVSDQRDHVCRAADRASAVLRPLLPTHPDRTR